MNPVATTAIVLGGLMVSITGLATSPADPIDELGRPTVTSTVYEAPSSLSEAPTPTTVAPIGACWPVYAYALQAGFTPDEALILDRIAWLESRCTANAVGDHGESLGILQVHAPSWCRPNVYNPVGYLQAALVLNSCEELFDPVVAVNAARAIYLYGGFEQWSTYEEAAS